ncbi:nuclease [candidate division KSB1 bacterium]|nr:MAG: nuclease [candidate division KSB1 bacterium]RKY87450.1 MAG: nuclease [candidate division KSB1 bacterium]
MERNLYYYRAIVTKVYDGDTCTVDVDLGLHTWVRGERIRLSRIDAPELRKKSREAGLRSRDFLRELILGKEIILQTIKDRRGRYGRYLGEIWLLKDGQYVNVNDLMLERGYAVPLEY